MKNIKIIRRTEQTTKVSIIRENEQKIKIFTASINKIK